MKVPGNAQGPADSREDMLVYVRSQDPEGAEKLAKLLERKERLLEGNIYGERFTERQFSLIFDPLLTKAVERSRMLELLRHENGSVPAIAKKLGLETETVFDHIRELLRRDLIEIDGYEDRYALYRKKTE